jgi:hypothetical protein
MGDKTMNTKTSRVLLFLVFGVLLLGQIQEVFPQKAPLEPALSGSTPTINTENTVYQFGDRVAIRGENFVPFQPVLLTVRRSDEGAILLINDAIAAEWIVIADENGALGTGWVINFEGTRFTVGALGPDSKTDAETEFIVLAGSADLDQCRNGTLDAPARCTGSNWVNGNLNASQAHYVEGESVPYRMRFVGLPIGAHTVTIEWDTTESAKHALDYLTTFNRTEVDAEPCSGVTGCDPAAYSAWAIPVDDMVIKGADGLQGTADDIGQIPGEFRLYGGTITGLSAYTMTGDFTGGSQTRITVSFTASVSNPVLAWGGHISTRGDWGTNNSAIAIGGAPYHIRLYDLDGSGGNQDRSLQSGAVYYPGAITIIKDAQPDTASLFSFTAVGPSVSDFILDDNGSNTDTYPNTKSFTNLTNFGPTHTVTITEGPATGYWYLTQLTCTSDPGGGSGTNNNVITLAAHEVEIFLEEGETVTCTYVNAVITAASVAVGGSVTDANGTGIYGAVVTLTRMSTGEQLTLRTNPFGRYMFEDVASGEDYLIYVYDKGYSFDAPSVYLTPTDNTTNVDFRALPSD